MQPSPGASVVCNGARLSASHWLRDGDALRLGPTRVEVSVRADGMRLVVLALGEENPTEPPVVLVPPPRDERLSREDAAPGAPIQPIGYTPRRSGPLPRPRRAPRGRTIALAGLLLSRGRAGRPRVAAGHVRRGGRSRARRGGAARPLAGRAARLALRGAARLLHARRREGRLPPARGAGPGDGRGGAGDRAGDAAPAGPPHRGHRRRRRSRGRGGRPDRGARRRSPRSRRRRGSARSGSAPTGTRSSGPAWRSRGGGRSSVSPSLSSPFRPRPRERRRRRRRRCSSSGASPRARGSRWTGSTAARRRSSSRSSPTGSTRSG